MDSGKKRVLLFEDDYESMYNLKVYLEEQVGWDVELTAEKGILERLSQEKFDLIAVDLMIQPVGLDASSAEVKNVHFDNVNWRQTGLEFVRRLRNGEFNQKGQDGTSKDVPVIILSAFANHSTEDKLEEEFVVEDYMEKPFRLDTLVNRIKELLVG